MIRLAWLLSLLIAAPSWADDAAPPHVLAQLPSHELKVGDLFDVPINILSEEMEIVSYAVELKFDPSLVALVDAGPGMTPWYNDRLMHKTTSSTISITGSASSFGITQKIVNVANLRFRLVGESSRPAFELLQTGPVVRREGFVTVQAFFSVEGEMNLWNFMYDNSFE